MNTALHEENKCSRINLNQIGVNKKDCPDYSGQTFSHGPVKIVYSLNAIVAPSFFLRNDASSKF